MRFVFVLTLGLSWALLPQPPQGIPSSLLASAQLPPLQLAFLLVKASVPLGIELRQSDDIVARRTPAFNGEQNKTIPASDLVTAFNAQHGDYLAVLVNGVFVIRPREGTSRFLDSKSTIDRLSVTGIRTAQRRIFSGLDPKLLGVVLNSMGREGDDTEVLLDGRDGRTVIDLLNDIVLQFPSGWQVTTHQVGNEWQVAAFGIIYPNGSRNMHPMSGN
jgi:hypothetical protein